MLSVCTWFLSSEGGSRQEYTRRREDMGISDHVTWVGLVAHPFGEGRHAAADMVCQMSRWEEGFGLVIAEPMAHGRPVVSTRGGASPKLSAMG